MSCHFNTAGLPTQDARGIFFRPGQRSHIVAANAVLLPGNSLQRNKGTGLVIGQIDHALRRAAALYS